ncbi:phospholipase [Tardiphaga alba]|uniref:Phospholipase n=1 Tax=Tardiphaga alba TaxID=340268 RepID=A0ABX8AFR2_9BRAD|nr:phospholipase [Tardiphaga alba]QUS41756.1 phospholipase [Tardiphaga alba]
MSDKVVDDIVALLPPLLQTLEALQFVARHLHPPAFDSMMDAVGRPDVALQEVRAGMAPWPDEFADLRRQLDTTSDAVIAGFAGLCDAQKPGGDITMVFRAVRHATRAQEALYATVGRLPPVSSFFLPPALREDAALVAQLAQPAAENTGVMHGGEPGARGGFSLYVPEYYTPDRTWPLVMALHGGSGNGRAFLWSWVADTRARGAIVVAPTAVGGTWALMGDDPDTPNIARILEFVQGRYNVDRSQQLLTGMSDGGTFCHVSGLRADSPFTHLAPVAATFHPLMAQFADADRLRDLPIHLVHGRLDWMFPVQTARDARDALTVAGAHVAYREIDDLSHAYPREINTVLLDWMSIPR